MATSAFPSENRAVARRYGHERGVGERVGVLQLFERDDVRVVVAKVIPNVDVHFDDASGTCGEGRHDKQESRMVSHRRPMASDMQDSKFMLTGSDGLVDPGDAELQLPVGSRCRKRVDPQLVACGHHLQRHVVGDEQEVYRHLQLHPLVTQAMVRAEAIGCVGPVGQVFLRPGR